MPALKIRPIRTGNDQFCLVTGTNNQIVQFQAQKRDGTAKNLSSVTALKIKLTTALNATALFTAAATVTDAANGRFTVNFSSLNLTAPVARLYLVLYDDLGSGNTQEMGRYSLAVDWSGIL